jgi:CHAD domain-containing protein
MSNPPSQEVEAKFTILDPSQALFLQQTPVLTARFVLAPASVATQRDTYVDTAAYHLLRHGYALRVRQTKTGPIVTVKSLSLAGQSHLHRRLELEAPIGLIHDLWATAHWPAPIRQFVHDLLGGDFYLQPISILQQTRWKRLVIPVDRWSSEAAQPLAELSVDEVQVYDPAEMVQEAQGTPTTHLLTTFWEAEAELLPNQAEAQLEQFIQKLSRVRSLRSSRISKLERGLALASAYTLQGEQAQAHIQPTMHTADACRLIWRQQMTQLLLNEAGVRYSDDSEYIHDMRVAIRRARVALRLFGGYFRRKSIRDFGDHLRTTGRKLGAVRDLDVALAKLTKAQKQTITDELDLPRIEKAWLSKREQAFSELLTWLDSAEYSDFVAEFTDFCQTAARGARRYQPVEGKTPTPYQLRHVAPSLMIERFARVRAFETLLTEPDAMPPTTLHQLRIQCKFLRYHLEFVQHLLGPAGRQLIQALKQLQESLGDLNDAAVGQRLLEEIGDEVDRATATAYHTAQTEKLALLRNQVSQSFSNLIQLENRRRLAQALARI